jgi:fatty-acyl-CoA synthase
MANILGMSATGLDIRPEDRAISWLPFYHDMGLIGFMLGPICNQLSTDLLPTREFARRPSVWLNMISQNRNTVSYSPTFGYDLSMRRLSEEQVAALDLSCWRRAGIGGDMVQPQVLRRFAEIFAPSGFREGAFVPSYGMAETCLAVACAPADDKVRVDRVLRAGLSAGRAEAASANADEREARTFAICGLPLPLHALEVRDEQEGALPDRRIGRVFVRGPSVTPGYFNQPEATEAVLHADGWLDTGDLGYMLDGELIVTGRAKDLIIVNGRNIWPQDLEWAVEALPGLRRGDVAAFAVHDDEHGGEDVVVLVQARLTDVEARDELRRAVEAAVREQAAIDCRVVLVPPHALPQTSSGKLSRSRARNNYLQGQYGEPADLELADS